MITFDPASVTTRIAELEEELGRPGFWDDQRNAARVSTEHSRLTKRLERYERLQREHDDAAELLAIDPELAEEIEAQLRPLSRELERLQEDALFNGEYDGGDAVVSIHAGAGGTDAQDWAEMMLRMYLRWADDRGFTAELVDASPGEEAGLKSATFTVKGENAYGILKAERGVHRLVRQSPFDSAHRRHTAFAQTVVAPLLPEDERRRDRRDRSAHRHLPRLGRGRPAREQDRLRRPDHPPAHRHRRPVPERALPDLEQADGDAHPQVPARRAPGGAARGRARQGARSAQDIGFGSQIRSYVLHPYQLVKDHRTDFEVGNAQGVLDGNLDGFVHAYLLAKAAGKVV